MNSVGINYISRLQSLLLQLISNGTAKTKFAFLHVRSLSKNSGGKSCRNAYKRGMVRLDGLQKNMNGRDFIFCILF